MVLYLFTTATTFYCIYSIVFDYNVITFVLCAFDSGENKKLMRRMDSMETKDSDPGVKSENEDDSHIRSKPSLGRTPNHLSLSTTSTLSTGSSSSQVKLVQVRSFFFFFFVFCLLNRVSRNLIK